MFLNRAIGFSLLLGLVGELVASLPELSAIEPLEFDEASQRLVARGDAELLLGRARLRADRITFFREYGLADAEGSVVGQRDGLRVLADRIAFDTNDQVISAQNFRTGIYPIYVEGAQAGVIGIGLMWKMRAFGMANLAHDALRADCLWHFFGWRVGLGSTSALARWTLPLALPAPLYSRAGGAAAIIVFNWRLSQ